MDIFKENKEFWIYIIGIVLLFFLFFWGASYFLRGEYFGIGGEKQDPASQIPNTFDEPPEFTIDTDKDYVAEFQTNLGTFKVDLFERNAPNNVNNFVFLASQGYYDNLPVHTSDIG